MVVRARINLGIDSLRLVKSILPLVKTFLFDHSNGPRLMLSVPHVFVINTNGLQLCLPEHIYLTRNPIQWIFCYIRVLGSYRAFRVNHSVDVRVGSHLTPSCSNLEGQTALGCGLV